ncbi:MAG: TonB-dependent receptor [Calditrichaeota bacterium]|nr:MAG: TonB-dependent receptor [Calditrichota bacterium]
MRRLEPFIMGVALLLIAQSVIFSQPSDKTTIKGYVLDKKTGETLPYANVTIPGSNLGTSSNQQGYFVLLNVSVGPCTLRVHYIGYNKADVALAVKKNMPPLKIKMQPIVLEGDEVTITAESYETVQVAKGISELKISPRGISKLPSVGEVDIFRSLQLLPGISAANDGSSGLYIRGGTPEQNLALFDGMTIYNVDHFFGFISAFNADAVKDVRVFKGGFPAKYGGRTSGVVELTGKSGSYDDFHAAGNINLLSGSGVVQVPLKGKGSWLTTFRRSYVDFLNSGLYDKIYDAVSGANNGTDEQTTSDVGGRGPGGRDFQQELIMPDFYYYDLNSKLTYSHTPNDVFSVSLYRGRDFLDESQYLGQRTLGPMGGGGEVDASINDLTEWGNTGLSVKYAKVWSDRFISSFLGSFSRYNSQSATSRAFRGGDENTIRGGFSSNEENNVEDTTYRMDNELHLSASHKLEFGLGLTKIATMLDFTANDTLSILNRKDNADQFAFYFQDEFKPSTLLNLTVGARVVDYNLTGKKYLEPRASINLKLTDKIDFKGAWGHYHQFINRIVNENVLEGNRDFWLLSDESLDPGFSEHFILGTSYENSNYLFSAEAYFKNMDGVTEFSQRFRRSPDTEPEDLFFTGTGISKGLEFLAQKKHGRFNGWLSYTLSKVDYDIEVFNEGEPYPADHDRTHEFKSVGSYSWNDWTFAATWVYASGAPYTAPESQYSIELLDGSERSYIHVSDKNANRLPNYHRLDLSATRGFSTENIRYELGLSVFNLYNHDNVWYREYVLDTSPIIVRDVTTLGFTPSINFKISMK